MHFKWPHGANLIMLGKMGMAGDVDKLSVEHGEAMMKDGKSMVTDMIEGKEMEALHAKSMTMKNPVMAMTHHQGEAVM